VDSVSLRTAGDKMDTDIIEFVKLRYSLLIGEPTAERTKIALADAKPTKEVFQVVRGRDLETGLPRSVKLSNFEVYEAIKSSLNEILECALALFEEAPPELISDVMQGGLIFCGGGALIKNLDVVLSETLNVSVVIAEDPLNGGSSGMCQILTDRPLLKKVSHV